MYHHVLFFQITVYCVFFATEGVRRSIARGVLLGIVGGDVSPGSSNPDPISDQKNVILHTRSQTRPLKSIPFFRPGL